jgi:hypothetical protein
MKRVVNGPQNFIPQSNNVRIACGSPEQGLQTLPTRGLRPRRGAGTRAC